MDLVKQLDQDMIDAMKMHEKERLTIIREIKANMKLANIDQKRDINDELMIEVVSKGIKIRRESIKEFEKGGRSDLIEKTNFEIELLEKYLPEQLSLEEVVAIIDKVFEEVKPTAMSDMGKVMGCVTPLVKGKADMGMISKIVREKLS